MRALDASLTTGEAMDPEVMVTMTGNGALAPIGKDARARLTAALDSLTRAQPVS